MMPAQQAGTDGAFTFLEDLEREQGGERDSQVAVIALPLASVIP